MSEDFTISAYTHPEEHELNSAEALEQARELIQAVRGDVVEDEQDRIAFGHIIESIQEFETRARVSDHTDVDDLDALLAEVGLSEDERVTLRDVAHAE